jgi:CHAP domain
MAGLETIKGAARLAVPALLAGALAACAAGPAPVRSAGSLAALPKGADPGAEVRILRMPKPLQCAPYAREISGIRIYGDANTWWEKAAGRYPRSSHPAPGAVLVLRGYGDPGRGHVAVVAAVVSAREVLVDHANWLNRGEVSLNVPVLDVSANNDWSEVRVWYVPGRAWGARIYHAEGFIHPFPLAPTS